MTRATDRVTWSGKVISRDLVVGVEAGGWGPYAVITDDQATRTLYLEFPRGSVAFSRMMDTADDFGPKIEELLPRHR